MRHLSVAAVMIGLGVLCTWLTATSLERYQLRHHAVAQIDQVQTGLAADRAFARRATY